MSWLRMAPGKRLDELLSAAPGAVEADSAMRHCLQAHLTPRLYAMIGVAVAGCLGCERFVDALRGPLESSEAVQIARDRCQAALTVREKAVLAYAEKGTLDEASVRRGDVDALRAQGFDDKDVLVIATAVAYHNYAVRMAAAFDVSPHYY